MIKLQTSQAPTEHQIQDDFFSLKMIKTGPNPQIIATLQAAPSLFEDP